MIVDDDPVSRSILAKLLCKEYAIIEANNGETALRISMSNNPPDLILLDIMMPAMDGYEVCKRLKADSQTNNIPIIFITAMDSEQDENRGFEVGAVDYITKPFRPLTVKSRVHTHVEIKRQRDVLENLSLQDGLTGIPNRRRFEEYLLTAGEFVARSCSSLSFIILDIDHFKEFNDHYGHYEGDQCIRRIAAVLAASIRRKVDLVARYGGEEFACILPGTSYESAINLAKKINHSVLSLEIPHATSTVSPFVTVSVGVSTAQSITNSKSLEKIITAADQALYLSKKQGRNQTNGIELTISEIDSACHRCEGHYTCTCFKSICSVCSQQGLLTRDQCNLISRPKRF